MDASTSLSDTLSIMRYSSLKRNGLSPMEKQSTIQKSVSVEGIGLHTGAKVRLRLKPAPPNSGIIFVRVDLPGQPKIPANINYVIDLTRRPRRTSVGFGDIEIHTIEHLMATLSCLGVDNLIVESNGNELPGLDGSALPFVELVRNAGIEKQDFPRKIFHVKESLWIHEDDAYIVVVPDDEFRISYTLSYDHPLLKSQFFSHPVNEQSFQREIAPGRTFCLQREAEELRSQGLGKGANYENTVVVGEKGVIQNKLRFRDEFVRHKVLDLIGDLYLLGYQIRGHVIAVRSGHQLNIKLLQRLRIYQERIGLGAIVSPTPERISQQSEMDIHAIQKILPHRPPFLLIDKIVELVEDTRAVGIKNVTINDNFFVGHFPNRPVMPGVLIVEAMAQVGGVLMLSKPENHGKLAYFMSIDRVKFRKPVIPGDQLVLEVEVAKLRTRTGQMRGRAFVDGKLVSEAELMFSIVDA